MILNRAARLDRLSLISLETISRCAVQLGQKLQKELSTDALINWEALNCAVTPFKTSFTIEGSTRSS